MKSAPKYFFKMQQIKGSVVNSIILGRNHFCCLCFKTVADCAIHIEDKVFVKKHDKTYDEIYMIDILTNILSPEISDQLSIFNAVCNKCSSEAINSYKFFTKCKDNLQNLGHIIHGLTEGTDILCLSNSEGSKAGFISINTENFEYKGLKSGRTSSTSLLAYQIFLSLQNKHKLTAIKTATTNIKPRTEKRKVLRLRLARLNPKVLNKHTVFVCPTCDQFFVRRNSMHKHYKRKHCSAESSKVDDSSCNYSPSVIKTNEECVNLTSLANSTNPVMKSKETYSHPLKIKPKQIESVDHAFKTYYLDERKINFPRKVPLILKRSRKILSKTN